MSTKHTVGDVKAAIDDLIADAYQRGLTDGSRLTVERIMQAASGAAVGVPPAGAAPITPPQAIRSLIAPASNEKVPNGTIRPIVGQVLGETPGLPTADVGRRACEIDPRITPASVNNELSRNCAAGVAKRGRGDILYEKIGSGWHLARRLPASHDDHERGPEAVTPRPYMNGVTSEAPGSTAPS